MNLSRLLKYGYFPKELPPPFTTFPFGEFAESFLFPTVSKKYISKPVLHNLARPSNQRRLLSIPNPFNYYLVALLLDQNASVIARHFNKSNLGISKPVIDDRDFRGFVTENDGKNLPELRVKSRSGARFILRDDIARFYQSIYTHSIPWALLGKTVAKKQRSGGFENELDLYMRNAQDGQTMGIPVGPDASLIVAEIVCCAIDEKLQEIGLTGFRFMDDFEFSFLSREDAELAHTKLEKVLQEFELGLNVAKKRIDQLPIGIDSWRQKVKGFQMDGYVVTSKLLEYFDMLFLLHKENPEEPILRYGIARLKSLDFLDNELLVDLLSQCILVEPGTLRESLSLIEKINLQVPRDKFSNILNLLIKIHAPLGHGSEVAWAIWACIFYNIPISDEAGDQLKDTDDSIIALLALHAVEKGLLHRRVKQYWSDYMTSTSLVDGHWLLAYEADLKGWLPSKDQKNHISQNEYFRALKQDGIFFYNADVDYLVSEAELDDGYEDATDNSTDEDTETTTNPNSDDLPF